MDYTNQNKRYEEILGKYRAQTQEIREKDKTHLDLMGKDNFLCTDKEVRFGTVKENNIEWHKNPILIEDKTYEFVNFIKTKIGKNTVLTEEDMVNVTAKFWNVDFTDCVFKNIKFINCNFKGCKFSNCKTEEFGIVFENCIFDSVLGENNEAGQFVTKVAVTEFEKCWITAKFRNCRMNNFIWDQCTFILCTFNNCSIKDSIFNKCSFYSVDINN